jgi:hypothetical protein
LFSEPTDKKMNAASVVWLTLATALVLCAGHAASFRTLNEAAASVRLNRDHSLVLVPVAAARRRRSADDDVVVDNDVQQPKKYQRLAHSVHVQSDIRFR